MGNDAELLGDPRFQRLLARRSRWRWGLSGFLIGAYLLYGVLGIYVPEFYASRFPGSAMPTGMAIGIFIIILSIVLSMLYVRVVNRIEAAASLERDQRQ